MLLMEVSYHRAALVAQRLFRIGKRESPPPDDLKKWEIRAISSLLVRYRLMSKADMPADLSRKGEGETWSSACALIIKGKSVARPHRPLPCFLR
jgi:hypothetical protein